MNKPVKVTANEAGQVIVPSQESPGWGYIRVEQIKFKVDEEGFTKKTKLSALVKGSIEDLKDLGWTAGQEIPGTIAIVERMTPFNPKNPEKDYKVAGDTNIVCTVEGKPIYRNGFYKINPNVQDIIIPHDNGDAIKEAKAKQKAEGQMSGSEEKPFSLD